MVDETHKARGRMAQLVAAPAERLANHFVDYLFDEYRGARHVRRVASWVGLVVLGIAKLAGTNWKVPRDRQLKFDHAGRSYRARYNHKAGPRGGIEIVEVLPGRGSPVSKPVTTIKSLREAEDFYAARLRRDPWP